METTFHCLLYSLWREVFKMKVMNFDFTAMEQLLGSPEKTEN